MYRVLKRLPIVIVVSFLVASILYPLAMLGPYAGAAAAPVVSPDGWELQDPPFQWNQYYGVWGSSSSDVIAVGTRGSILRYGGVDLSPMTSGTTNNLYGIWGDSSYIYVVGESGTILRCALGSTTWSPMASGTTQTLYGVWGDIYYIYVVGESGTILRCRFDSTTWSPMASGTTKTLYGVWSTSYHTYAVGELGTILHYSGDAWSPMTSGTWQDLAGVWGTAWNDVFAVGNSGSIRHYDGFAWSSMTSGATFDLAGVWGSSSSDVFAVGGAGSYTDNILHYDGSDWGNVDLLDTPGSYGHKFRGIWGTSSSDVFAVGYSTVFHFDGLEWSRLLHDTYTHELISVWGTSPSDVFAIGSLGVRLHYSGDTWNLVDGGVPTGQDIQMVQHDIWGSSSSDVFIVGAEISAGPRAHIWHGTWTYGHIDIGDELFAVWGSSSTDVFAVGGSGTILHCDGTSWTLMTSDPMNGLKSVWGSSSSDVFAVGSTTLHYDGSTWSPMTTGTTADLNSIWGSSSSDVFAVGGSGTILHYDGTSWTPMSSGTTYTFSEVWGSSSSNVFAVGHNGTILHYDGNTWSPMASGTTKTLNAIWGTSSSDVFVVGDDCTILHHAEHAPSRPANTSPTSAAIGIGLTPTLSSSAFSDPDTGDTHAASQWQITPAAGDFSSPLFDSARDTANLTSMAIPPERLDYCTTYYWHVRHQDSHGAWSDYSSETSFTTLNRPPNQPSNIAPLDGAIGVILSPTLQSSAFSDPDQSNTHAASHWQITSIPGDYSTPVLDSGVDAGNLTSIDIPSGLLAHSTTYYWHVRHQDNHGAWSDYSTETSFTTFSRPPSQPSNVSPANAAAGVTLMPELTTSAFSDPDSADTHAASQWQITSTSGDYSSPVFDSGVDTGNLTDVQVPLGPLSYSTTYYWRVRYQDNRGLWSDWSLETSFTTPLPPQAEFAVTSVKTSGGVMLIFFSNLSSGGASPLTYAWDFDSDGVIDAPEREPWHRYAASGTYTVSLTVTDAVGNIDTEVKVNCLTILPPQGGKMETADGQISTDFPSGAVAGSAVVTIKSMEGCQLPDVPQGFKIGNTRFVIMALDEDGSEIVTLSQPTTITVKYSEADVAAAGGDPENLILAYWDEAAEEWKPLDTVVNTAEMTLTASTTHLSTWAILVAPASSEPLPAEGTQGIPVWAWVLVGIGGALIAGVVLVKSISIKFAHEK